MSQFALICVGGAAGTGVRHLAGLLAVHWLGAGFPYGTLAVNLAGAFLIGLVQQLAGALIPEPVRLFLVVGVLGGMTTYSAFTYETVHLMTLAEWGKAWANLVVTTGLCLGLCWLGHGRWAARHRRVELGRARRLDTPGGSARVRAHVVTARGAPRAALRPHPMAAHG